MTDALSLTKCEGMPSSPVALLAFNLLRYLGGTFHHDKYRIPKSYRKRHKVNVTDLPAVQKARLLQCICEMSFNRAF